MPTDDVRAHYLQVERDLRRRAEIAQLLLDAARSLTETLEIDRVYDRFHELLADVIPHDGVIVSSFDQRESLITCEYASVEENRIDPATLPPLKLSAGGGMQSEVIRTGESLLANDVAERVQSSEGTFYDVDREGTVRKVPDLGPTRVQSAMMVPVTEGDDVPQAVTLPIDVDRRELWLSFVAVRISMGGVVYAFRDQTAEHKLDAAQSDFIATVSHELRTPMTAVYGAARTLLRSDVDLEADESRALLEMIATQSERLAQITEEVLLASRLDRGTVTVEREQVDVAEIARETAAAMERHLGPRASFDLELPGYAYVTGDRDRIRQIVTNLIDNAAKYSREGGKITVSVEEHDGGVRLSVSDEGVGIPVT